MMFYYYNFRIYTFYSGIISARFFGLYFEHTKQQQKSSARSRRRARLCGTAQQQGHLRDEAERAAGGLAGGRDDGLPEARGCHGETANDAFDRRAVQGIHFFLSFFLSYRYIFLSFFLSYRYIFLSSFLSYRYIFLSYFLSYRYIFLSFFLSYQYARFPRSAHNVRLSRSVFEDISHMHYTAVRTLTPVARKPVNPLTRNP